MRQGRGEEEVCTSSLFCCEPRTALKKIKSVVRNGLELGRLISEI